MSEASFRREKMCSVHLNHALFFIYGFAKSQKENITEKEKKALKRLGKEMLGYSDKKLVNLVNNGELIEVNLDEET